MNDRELRIYKYFVMLLLIILSLLIIISILFPKIKIFGKDIWYEPKRILYTYFYGNESSKHLVDIYSLTHISHGIIFFIFLKFLGLNRINAIIGSMILELFYEITANSSFVINIYRKKWEKYTGDSLVNNVSDMLFCLFGIYLTEYNIKYGIIYLFLSEFIFYFYKVGLIEHVTLIFNKIFEILTK